MGELGPGYLKGDAYIDRVSYNQWFAGILTGKSIVGLRAEDIIRMARFLGSGPAECRSVSVISVGVIGSEVLHAAVFDTAIQRVCLLQPFTSFAEIALAPEYAPRFIPSTVAGAISKYDLADLMAVLGPRKLLIINPLLADGSLADEQGAGKSLSFPAAVYTRQGKGEHFSLICGKEDRELAGIIMKWLNMK